MRILKLIMIVSLLYTMVVGLIAVLAASGFVMAQLTIGVMFARGYGVPQKPEYAFYWYSEASEQSQIGKLFLGLAYYQGTGTKVDNEKAVALIKESAESGVLQAQLTLGNLLSTTKHKKYAYIYYTMAVNQGSKEAKIQKANLINSMSKEEIVEAEKLFNEACCKF